MPVLSLKNFRIFIIEGSHICPVEIFNFYLEKLNERRTDFWQRPKHKVRQEDPVWYDDARDTLNDAMKNISIETELSQIYMNHSIRATAVMLLDSNNFEAHHIQAVSEPKSEATICTNTKYCPPSKKREMFNVLTVDNPRQKSVEAPPEKRQNLLQLLLVS